MIRRAAVLLLACGVLAASGCCGWVYRPFGPGTLCNTSNCGCCEPCAAPCGPFGGPVCGPACGPVCGPACGPVCETPCDTCEAPCDGCGMPGPCGPTCGPACGPPCGGPIAWRHPLLAAIFHPIQWAGGCQGCGELYLGDFHSSPPDCCDPCDRCGNWTGGCGCAGASYPPGPVMAGPPPTAAPAAAPTSSCPNCGKTHASVKKASQGYVSNQPPRMISPTSGMMPTRPVRANPYATQAAMRPTNTTMR